LPWYRRNGPVIALALFTGPVVGLIALTGPIYYRKDGQVAEYSFLGRVFIAAVAFWWLLGLPLSGSGPGVTVKCQSSPPEGVACVVQQDGKKPIQACFDFYVQCANGMKPKVNRCQELADKQPVTVTIREAEIVGLQQCDKVTGGGVENLQKTVSR
jgi:hypothetical protein